ncbi:MAG TPA: hypothetical protein DCL41_05955 [Bdellovibrionales bacterium]|nr:hypothetical protein [Pseudobdellovibrionaceae bacterium]HAG91394.1 hypothetical protein [Bdellovibrionales bacterium]
MKHLPLILLSIIISGCAHAKIDSKKMREPAHVASEDFDEPSTLVYLLSNIIPDIYSNKLSQDDIAPANKKDLGALVSIGYEVKRIAFLQDHEKCKIQIWAQHPELGQSVVYYSITKRSPLRQSNFYQRHCQFHTH